MSAKKVFTHSGELLASFLTDLKPSKTQQDFDNMVARITTTTGTTQSTFWDIQNINREEVLTIIKRDTLQEIENLSIGDGVKEVQIIEAVQALWNNLKYTDVRTEAQFQALLENYCERLAQIYKNFGILNRSTQRASTALNNAISSLLYKKLDYFIGSDEDKSTIYYRFQGSTLKIANGQGNTQTFYPVIRAKETTANGKDYVLGDTLYIGGTNNDQFKSIELTQETKVQGDLIIADGFELIGTAIVSRFGDVAEYYSSDKVYSPGTLLELDTQNNNEVTIYKGNADSITIGIVSENPGFILNEAIKEENPNIIHLPVVLTGKSPVRVLGEVHKGDYLIPLYNHKYPGCCKAIKAIYIDGIKSIGIALESSLPSLGNESANNDIHLINAKIN